MDLLPGVFEFPE